MRSIIHFHQPSLRLDIPQLGSFLDHESHAHGTLPRDYWNPNCSFSFSQLVRSISLLSLVLWRRRRAASWRWIRVTGFRHQVLGSQLSFEPRSGGNGLQIGRVMLHWCDASLFRKKCLHYSCNSFKEHSWSHNCDGVIVSSYLVFEMSHLTIGRIGKARGLSWDISENL